MSYAIDVGDRQGANARQLAIFAPEGRIVAGAMALRLVLQLLYAAYNDDRLPILLEDGVPLRYDDIEG